MIGRLSGKLVKKQAPSLLLEVNGVGYELEAPMTTFYEMPETGASVTLHTHLLVREDAQLLYGFHLESDRDLFRTLIKINGVGAKLALALMSGMTAAEMSASIQADDVNAFTRVPGVGKKTAARLMVELKDRLQVSAAAVPSDVPRPLDAVQDPLGDAVSALVALGYKPQEASRMVRGVETTDLPSEEIVRRALRAISY